MRKIMFGLLLALLVATPVSAYVIQKGDTPFGLWGSNWVQEMSKQIGHTDQYNLPVGVDVELGEMLGGTPTPTSSAAIKYVETPDFFAYEPAVAGDTSITINNLKDIYGNTLTMADFGSLGYGRIDPDGAEVSESFTFSGVTANSDGTYTLTGVKSVLAKYPYTQTSGLTRSHSINAIVRFTNTAAFYDNFANKENDEIVDGSWTFLNNTFLVGDGTNTNKTFRFNNGATNTPEMVYDATTNQLKFRRSGETSYTEIPLSLRGTYPDYASLPTVASEGDIAITSDDNKLYTYDLSGTTWVLAGGSSGAGTVYKTEKLGSESDGGDLKTFTLTAGSWPSPNFLLVYKNGQLQRIGTAYDYIEIDSNTIEFTYELATDDLVSMVVVSVDLYNPAWGLVNADILPDTDNAYDIGSSSLQFKDIYLEGDLIKNGDSNWWTKFGGTGADGALSITSGTTTIDLGGEQVFEKNYSSISITGTGVLTFSNPNTRGTIITLKSSGNVVITSTASNAIVLSGLGAASTNRGMSNLFSPIGGGTPTAGTGIYIATSSVGRVIPLIAGAGGGNGGGGECGTTIGGRGAGSLFIEVGGSLNLTGTINANGVAGQAGFSAGGDAQVCAGAGGGGGGTVIILYNSLVAKSGTITTSGGAGGAKYSSECSSSPSYNGGGGGGSNTDGVTGGIGASCNPGNGGAGGDGFSYVGLNSSF